MFPVLLQIQGGVLSTYALFFSLACVFGILLWAYLGMLRGFSGERLITRGIVAVIAALAGARGLFIFTNWSQFFGGRFNFWRIWEGGIVFYGGLITATLYLCWSVKKDGIPRIAAFSALVPALAWAHAIGRLGCFANGCCYGRECKYPWGVTYWHPWSAAPLGVPLHPTQLYESLALLLLGAGLFYWETRKKEQQYPYFTSLRIYLLAYPLLRFFVEFFRGDLLRGAWAGFSTSQWISLGLLFFALSLRLSAQNTKQKTP